MFILHSFTDSELEIYKKMNNAMIQQIEELKKSRNEKEGKLFINDLTILLCRLVVRQTDRDRYTTRCHYNIVFTVKRQTH